MNCIATCFSHFGAIRCKRLCDKLGWPAKLMPVPRDLSSSCGTCVRFQGALPPEIPAEVERILEITPAGYRELYRTEGL